MSKNFTTPIGRVSFPNLWEATSYMGSDPKYSLLLIFTPDQDISEMKDQASEAVKELFKGKTPKKLRTPFRDGTEHNDEREENGKERMAGLDGNIYVRFSSKVQPGVFDQNRNPLLADSPLVYGGCMGRVITNAFAYNFEGANKGVSFGLSGFQLAGGGERFGSAPATADDFSDLPMDDGNLVEDEMFN